jgi:hypothetical protein
VGTGTVTRRGKLRLVARAGGARPEQERALQNDAQSTPPVPARRTERPA